MNIVITGADGFIGKNLQIFLKEAGYSDVIGVTRADDKISFEKKLENADFIFHLAGINRPKNKEEFKLGNADLTESIVDKLLSGSRFPSIVFTSSSQIDRGNEYGNSKLKAEEHLKYYSNQTNAKVSILRLPNVFGKWCRPNYNSVIATFCHNIINELPVTINDECTELNLCYIDDLCKKFISLIEQRNDSIYSEVTPIYKTTLGEVARILFGFKEQEGSLDIGNVGVGLTRALYSTYISYYSHDKFSYNLPLHIDQRGEFVEMLKTESAGQFSYFTAGVGITRGGHYHHTKTEKFLVIRGKALFKFRHIVSNEYYEITIDGKLGGVVETIPGWSHDITNIGEEELIVMLWANEVFDRENPDTINYKVTNNA